MPNVAAGKPAAQPVTPKAAPAAVKAAPVTLDTRPLPKLKKVAPPPVAAQREAESLMEDVYKISQAKGREAKVRLAEQLLKVGKSTQIQATERYTLLRKASELAADGGDAAMMLAVVQEMGHEFDFDELAVREELLGRCAEGQLDGARLKAFLVCARETADAALAAGRDDLACAAGRGDGAGCASGRRASPSARRCASIKPTSSRFTAIGEKSTRRGRRWPPARTIPGQTSPWGIGTV